MNDEPDPLLARLRDLPSPTVDAPTRTRVLRAAEAELTRDPQRVAVARAWSVWALPAMLLASEAVYLADFFGKLRAIFFG
jgi:hypothetical protein